MSLATGTVERAPGTSTAQFRMYVGGEFVAAHAGRWLDSIDPYVGTPWASVPRAGPDDADRVVRVALAAGRDGWATRPAAERGKLLLRLADLIEANVDRLARIESRDNGKLLKETTAQVAGSANWYRYYGGLADKIEGRTLPVDKAGWFVYTRRQPVGVVVAITPWNSPLALAAWKVAPALAAGCTVVLKPSEHTSVSSLAMAELFDEAGFPRGVYNVVTGLGTEVGAALIEHPDVAKVSFTGSDANGRHIAQVAAKHLKKITLELGGKSPNIVFADADLDRAVDGTIAGIFAAAGQTCIAGSRLLVQRSIHDAFVQRLVARVGQARMGDPTDAASQISPVTTEPQFRKVVDYLAIACGEGAVAALGGSLDALPPGVGGWFVPPTIFTGVTNAMRIAREEVFGPVLAVIPFDDEADALAIANDTAFGLGAGVWTSDIARAIRMADRVRAGTVWVNGYRVSSPSVPFGGMKDSGSGRENGVEAIDEYLETKSVWVNIGAPIVHAFPKAP